jgi:hypothetical protein
MQKLGNQTIRAWLLYDEGNKLVATKLVSQQGLEVAFSHTVWPDPSSHIPINCSRNHIAPLRTMHEGLCLVWVRLAELWQAKTTFLKWMPVEKIGSEDKLLPRSKLIDRA